MSPASETALPDTPFVDPGHEVKAAIQVPGRFCFASRRDANGNRRQYACRAVNISQSYVVLATPISGPVGERVIAYFQEFGKIQGPILRVMNGGFAIRIAASNAERSRLLRKLIWFEQNKKYQVPDVRAHKRIVPEDPISTLIFSDGSMVSCFVIDMSITGVAVSADVVPALGTPVAVGKAAGKVVRHFEEGFAIQFQNEQNPALLEKVVIQRF
jgi:hypothetical protein